MLQLQTAGDQTRQSNLGVSIRSESCKADPHPEKTKSRTVTRIMPVNWEETSAHVSTVTHDGKGATIDETLTRSSGEDRVWPLVPRS